MALASRKVFYQTKFAPAADARPPPQTSLQGRPATAARQAQHQPCARGGGRHFAEEEVPFRIAAGFRGCLAAVLCLCRAAAAVLSVCRAVCALVGAAAAVIRRGGLASAAHRSDQGRAAAAHSCPPAVGAGAPATRGAAAELVDELVEDVGEASSELVLVAAVVGGGFVFVML